MYHKSIFQPTMFEEDLDDQTLINQVQELEDFVTTSENDPLC